MAIGSDETNRAKFITRRFIAGVKNACRYTATAELMDVSGLSNKDVHTTEELFYRLIFAVVEVK